MCTGTAPNIVVPFAVYECTGYNDKHKPTFEQMKKLAIPIQQLRMSHKTAGFSTFGTIRPVRKSGSEDQDEAARIR